MAAIEVRVCTPDKELLFNMPSKKSAQELFYEIGKNLGMRETWYFGLYFQDKNEKIYLDASRKKLSYYRAFAKQLQYSTKYYPEVVEDDLIEDITIRFFFLQVRKDIVSDALYCPAETCVLLASYAGQVKHGDFHDEMDLIEENMMPERVYKQHNMDKTSFGQSIAKIWKKHRGMSKEDAMMEYLKIVQNLEMFGVHYFNIKNAKGTAMLLGVTSLGLNIYQPGDKLNPTILFPWSEIEKLNYRGKKFIIVCVDKKSKNFEFFVDDEKLNKRIMNLGVGYHMLYQRRRKPETLEIAQMREVARARREMIESQKQKLYREIEARTLLEQRYKQEIQNLRDEVSLTQQQLMASQETIDKLNRRLAEIELAKKEYEERQNELEQMLRSLEESKHMEAAERQKLEDEIMAKQVEMQRIKDEVDMKDEETKRLQREVEEAKYRHEELMRIQQEEAAKREAEQLELERLAQEVKNDIPETIEVNEKLKEDMKELQSMLNVTRDDSLLTAEDKIHMENLRDGRNKYKTLNEIRKGNTTRRIDMFENA